MNSNVFDQFESYNFEKDSRYQQGLKSQSLKDSLQTRHFYFTKFYSQFDLQDFISHKQSCKLSFKEVLERVQKGQPIPGIKHIPDTVYKEDVEIQKPCILPIKKPWETPNSTV